MELFFTKDHEWMRIEGNTGTVGITHYAAHQLGDITFVDLPKLGKQVNKGGTLCSIESVKAASDIFAPMGGKVIEVNKKLDTEPQIINADPENGGWIAKIELSNISEKSGLLLKSQYDDFIKTL